MASNHVAFVTAGDKTNATVAHSLYGVCSTGATTTAKAVTMYSTGKTAGAAWAANDLVDGLTITVRFTNANTAGSPTLNVNQTGAKRIYSRDSYTNVAWPAQSTMQLTYDTNLYSSGCWILNGSVAETLTPATSVTSVGTSAVTGSSTNYARQDHVHNISSATITTALGFTPLAQSDIEGLSGAMHYVGTTTASITDGTTTKPADITGSGTSGALANGDVVISGEKEFVWNGSKWQEFGSTGSLKGLAFKDSATGSYTPSGTLTITLPTASKNVVSSVSTTSIYKVTAVSTGSVNSSTGTTTEATVVTSVTTAAQTVATGGSTTTVKTVNSAATQVVTGITTASQTVVTGVTTASQTIVTGVTTATQTTITGTSVANGILSFTTGSVDSVSSVDTASINKVTAVSTTSINKVTAVSTASLVTVTPYTTINTASINKITGVSTDTVNSTIITTTATTMVTGVTTASQTVVTGVTTAAQTMVTGQPTTKTFSGTAGTVTVS